MARILHLTHRSWPVAGGSERYLEEIAKRQLAAGHDVTICATNADAFTYFWDPAAPHFPAGETMFDGIRLQRFPIQHLPGKLPAFALLRRLQTRLPNPLASRIGHWLPHIPALAPAFNQLAATHDLICSWNITFDGLAQTALQAAQTAKIPLAMIPFFHLGENARSPVRRQYTMPHQIALLHHAAHIFLLTTVEDSYLDSHLIPSAKRSVVGAGIDPASVQGGDGNRLRTQLGIEGFLVAAIGAQSKDKGTGDLIKALRPLWAKERPIHLVLAGNIMPEIDNVYQQLTPNEKQFCHQLGRISEAEKRDLLAAMDLLVLPSRTDSFGIVFLEAWANGKAVIGAAAGGIPGVIKDGQNGRLVPFGDPSALRQIILELFNDPEKAAALGNNGRKSIPQYDWDLVYSRFAAALDPLLK